VITENNRRGFVHSINISVKKGTPKSPVPGVRCVPDCGLEGDAHSGPGNRQVSLLSLSSIERQQVLLKSRKVLKPGDFAENITVSGIDLLNLQVGAKLKIGDHALLVLSQIGKDCVRPCRIYRLAGTCVMPKEGIFAIVETGGYIRKNDPVEVVE
jgi:MOSC domain-containing protein YiiM